MIGQQSVSLLDWVPTLIAIPIETRRSLWADLTSAIINRTCGLRVLKGCDLRVRSTRGRPSSPVHSDCLFILLVESLLNSLDGVAGASLLGLGLLLLCQLGLLAHIC